MSIEKKHKYYEEEQKIHQKSIAKKINLGNIFIGLSVLLVVILIINIALTSNIKNDLKKSAEELKEKSRPARIELVVVKNSKCNDCFDISTILSNIKNANVDITKEITFEFDSKEGKEIINKYKIEKVPAVVITGQIDKVNIQGLAKKENALLLTRLEPPYTNSSNGKIYGRVTLYYLKDAECAKCKDLNPLINQIKSAGVKIYEEKIIALTSNEGNELIKKYKIDFAPTIILSKDAELYDVTKQAWPQVGTKEADGSYVLRLANPPFINLTNGRLRGIVNIIYLTDKSCADCYDVKQHKEILTSQQSFAIELDKEETFDIADSKGKELVAMYNITKVPTVILSDDISAYPSRIALMQFFSVEKDGSYVFRRIEVLGSYKDLITKQIVQVQQQSEEQ